MGEFIFNFHNDALRFNFNVDYSYIIYLLRKVLK